MKIINNHKRSKVYYNDTKDEYVKLFFPKFSKKLKYFFGLRKYPGHNFKFISDELNKLGIHTAKIIKYGKYSVITKNIDGKNLDEYTKGNIKHPILKDFIKIVSTILKNNIYFGDFNFKNFIVKNNKIYAIDLEDYRKEKFGTHSIDYAIKGMEEQLPASITSKVKEELTCSR